MFAMELRLTENWGNWDEKAKECQPACMTRGFLMARFQVRTVLEK